MTTVDSKKSKDYNYEKDVKKELSQNYLGKQNVNYVGIEHADLYGGKEKELCIILGFTSRPPSNFPVSDVYKGIRIVKQDIGSAKPY